MTTSRETPESTSVTVPSPYNILHEIMLDMEVYSPYEKASGVLQMKLEISPGTHKNAYQNPYWKPKEATLLNLKEMWLERGLADRGFFPSAIEQHVFHDYRTELSKVNNEASKDAFLTRHKIRMKVFPDSLSEVTFDLEKNPEDVLETCACIWLSGHIFVDILIHEDPKDSGKRQGLADKAISCYEQVSEIIMSLPRFVGDRDMTQHSRIKKSLTLLKHDALIAALLSYAPNKVASALDNDDTTILPSLREASFIVDKMVSERPWDENHLINRLSISSMLGDEMGCQYAIIKIHKYFDSRYLEKNIDPEIGTSPYLKFYKDTIRGNLSSLEYIKKIHKTKKKIVYEYESLFEKRLKIEQEQLKPVRSSNKNFFSIMGTSTPLSIEVS